MKMWRDYSFGYIKSNRASSISIVAAAFISALFLSLLSSLFYNFWAYEIDRLIVEEGNWHSRLEGEFGKEDLERIQNFTNVEKVVFNEELSEGQRTVVEISFYNKGAVFKDTVQIAEALSCEKEAVTYHYALLAMYLVRSPEDKAPRLIFPFLLAVTAVACITLILIIHNAFAVSMTSRVHQFGIFSSIGATPGQIRTCLLQEAAVLCALPIIAGNLLGIGISMLLINETNQIAADAAGRLEAAWRYHPFLFVITFVVTAVTIWISAWIPARKLSRMTPLEAIKNTGEFPAAYKRSCKKTGGAFLPLLFGIEGELAHNAWKAQKRNLRMASLALTFSFLAFFLMQCFFTLTVISQRMTYFERYQDAWDIMVEVKDAKIGEFAEVERFSGLSEIRSCIVYQKAMAKRLLTGEELSGELTAAGGLENAPEAYVGTEDGAWLVNAPIVIMDDASFLQYCRQIGAEPKLNGAVVLNRINHRESDNFRVRNYIPYIKENQDKTILRQAGEESLTAEIPIVAYAKEPPILREAYDELDTYVLVHFLPVSVWKEIEGPIGGADKDVLVCIRAREGVTLAELNDLEEKAAELASKNVSSIYETESENRIQAKITNDNMIEGMELLLGGFCILLAVIGIANVFSNALGFVQQRKREFARYLSVGLTPGGIRKIFCVEALIIVGKPVLTSLLVTIIFTGLMIKASYLDPMIFVREMPVAQILSFVAVVFAIVAFAYYLGGRKVMRSSLMEALKDDTLI